MISFDLGSNTLRATKIDCATKEKISEYEKIVKTADGLEKNAEISKNALANIIDAIKEAKQKIGIEKDEQIVAVATAAFRIANNSQKILEKIKKETGVEFEIISGTQEANYTALAVENRLQKIGLQNRDFLLLDLGGASSELYIKKDDRAFIKSFDIGIVTFTQKYDNKEDIEELLDKETKEIKKFLNEIYQNFSKPALFVSTAGTATTLSAFKLGLDYDHYNSNLINGTTLTKSEIKKLKNKLLEMDEAQRAKWVGVGRAEFIISGISILLKIIQLSDFEKIVVIDDSLREGVALSKCIELENKII